MSFLVTKDYKTQIKDEILNVIIRNDNNIRTDAELAALSEMQGYLRPRYDLDAIFLDIQGYDPLATYNEGDYVISSDVIYRALQTTQGNDPPNATFWEQRDDRNRTVVMRLIDMVLYHLHSALAPNKIPQLRMDRYDEAVKWLAAINEGRIDPGFPLVTDSESTDVNNPIKWNSSTKQNMGW